MAPKNDKAGEAYWSNFWEQVELPPAVDLSNGDAANYMFRKMHPLFSSFLKGNAGKSILEIGCGNSVFLSYFSKEFGLEVSGIDYSEYGCRQTQKILERDGVNGKVYLGDLFNPPTELIGQFDFVCSFGVIEHFEDTEQALIACARFLKKDGLLFTTIPNLSGLVGLLQKSFYKPVYDIHKMMTHAAFVQAHVNAKLSISQSGYFLPVSFGLTLEHKPGEKIPFLKIKKLITKVLQAFGKVGWQIDEKLFRLPQSQTLSAGIFVLCRRDS